MSRSAIQKYHISLSGMFEGYLELKNQIINSTNETRKNNGGN